jgi:hypothetical protein
MKLQDLNLDHLIIHASQSPAYSWNCNGINWEKYEVHGIIDTMYVGRINIDRGLNTTVRYNDGFFFDLTKNPPMPKPFVAWQETEKEYRGKGICGKIILLANEFYRGKLGTNLYSDTHFIASSNGSAEMVWKKLQENGLAMYEPYVTENGIKQDRWVIL